MQYPSFPMYAYRLFLCMYAAVYMQACRLSYARVPPLTCRPAVFLMPVYRFSSPMCTVPQLT